MNVYMLEDLNTGLFYRRRQCWECWVTQEKASVWTNRGGPAQARTCAGRMKKPKTRNPNFQIGANR